MKETEVNSQERKVRGGGGEEGEVKDRGRGGEEVEGVAMVFTSSKGQ